MPAVALSPALPSVAAATALPPSAPSGPADGAAISPRAGMVAGSTGCRSANGCCIQVAAAGGSVSPMGASPSVAVAARSPWATTAASPLFDGDGAALGDAGETPGSDAATESRAPETEPHAVAIGTRMRRSRVEIRRDTGERRNHSLLPRLLGVSTTVSRRNYMRNCPNHGRNQRPPAILSSRAAPG